jgi:hypothetical protein
MMVCGKDEEEKRWPDEGHGDWRDRSAGMAAGNRQIRAARDVRSAEVSVGLGTGAEAT